MKPGKLLVSVSVADVRDRSSHDSELLTQAVLGVELEAVRTSPDRNWDLVRLPDGCVGWVRNWSIVPVSDSDLSNWKNGIAFQVGSRSVAVHETPCRGSAVMCELVLGTRIPGQTRRGKWVRTVFPDSARGWVEVAGLDPLPPLRPVGPSVVRTALRFMGAPYLWGGTTPWGCDCSGLVQTVYSVNGLGLPRDAKDQLEATRDRSVGIRAGGFQPGDLLFFGRGREDISHVAIATGGFSFVHSRGSVRIGSLTRGELGYSLEVSRLLRAATRPLGRVKKNVDKKKGLQ